MTPEQIIIKYAYRYTGCVIPELQHQQILIDCANEYATALLSEIMSEEMSRDANNEFAEGWNACLDEIKFFAKQNGLEINQK